MQSRPTVCVSRSSPMLLMGAFCLSTHKTQALLGGNPNIIKKCATDGVPLYMH